VNVDYLWLIPILPLLGAVINGLLVLMTAHREQGPPRALSGWLGTAMVAGSFFLTWRGFLQLRGLSEAERALTQTWYSWIPAGPLDLSVGFLLDPLSAIMLLFVTGVGTLIHVYSIGYMAHDRGFGRFFAYLNLFMCAMILLVLGDNLIVLFVGWEGVGLCSYLLIGFWHKSAANAVAGMKAFIVNRIGDFGFLLGIFVLFWTLMERGHGTLNFQQMQAQANLIPAGVAVLAGLLLFVGATGKSAQIPLYVWLPDAMAGPTPVSALIHAATMVTSGVYMLARMNWLYAIDPTPLTVVAVIAAVTALMAATIGLTQFDIKKVLAYSTVSQLGYMFLACGVGAYGAAIFHVFTHAFFKALLFLGSGSVIHALHEEQDIRKMGGLIKKIPITGWTFVAGWLAICGIVPFAGFFSKDEILWKTWSASMAAPWLPKLLWTIGFVTAGLTALYMTRLVMMTFFGKSRVEPEKAHHIHESPWTMTVPLVVLAIGSLGVGFLGTPEFLGLGPNRFERWLHPVFAAGEAAAHALVGPHAAHGHVVLSLTAASHVGGAGHASDAAHVDGAMHTDGAAHEDHVDLASDAAHGAEAQGELSLAHSETADPADHATGAAAHGGAAHAAHDTTMEWVLMLASLGLAALGIAVGVLLYLRRPELPQRIAASFGGLYRLVFDKYRVDELYDAIIVRPLVGISREGLWKIVDVKIIDMLVNLVGIAAKGFSYGFRFLQTGYVQAYAFVILLGIAVILFRAF